MTVLQIFTFPCVLCGLFKLCLKICKEKQAVLSIVFNSFFIMLAEFSALSGLIPYV